MPTSSAVKPDPEKRIGLLGYALLGVLVRADLSGYDIARRMKEPVGFFWQAPRSQIYPELARLEEAGLVKHRLVRQMLRPDKRVYRVTTLGRAALAAWVLEPTPDIVRNEFVLKAHSLWLVDPARIAPLFRERAHEHAKALALYEGFRRELEAGLDAQGWPGDSPDLADLITVGAGIAYARSFGDWCEETAARLEAAARSRLRMG